MTVLTERRYAAEFISREFDPNFNREACTVLSGQVLRAGHVVGKVTLGAATPAAVAGNTGNGTIGAVTVGLGAKVGVYRATCIEPATNAGKFVIEDPTGITVGVATVAVAFAGGGLGFTIADGATDFASGDAFTITVAAGSGKVKEWNPANTDGSAVACAVLYDRVDATGSDKPGVILARGPAIVTAAELEWFTGADAGQKAAAIAQLRLLGILAN